MGETSTCKQTLKTKTCKRAWLKFFSVGKGESRGSLAYTSMDMQHAVGDGADEDSDDDLTLWQYLGKALWQKRKQDEEDTSMYDIMRKRD